MKVLQTLQSRPTQDGEGVKIARVADFRSLRLDPFLMIDELKSDNEADYIGGFPPHPHRGIETFTYMIRGGFEHRDQMGNRETISDGDVQWMSTGFGVVHSEMPVADTKGMHGFQIWINMPAKDKLRKARCQDSSESGLPELTNRQGVRLRALAGDWELTGETVSSPLNQLAADAAISDLKLPKNGEVIFNRSFHDQAFILVYEGEINGFAAGSLMIVDPEELIQFHASEESGALIFSANKIREEIAHYGPFVMNTQEQLQQAMNDYRAGKFGTI